ncbi:hypothetical protein FRC14_004607 [Serendipita sp. 396]|nr:hypothetical protein FRC14_004607 [Serendipita sp. 396]KAG8781882.1 hypothetical protein FRC15_007953 [Serendipita sp. 397]KAG8801151.1 hypothetical protein FRC16_001159 [Serendipita sp. 398]KAG8868983.1 hypothetical protein FRC20_002383 [Serendipita sp. 405]
MAAAAVGRVYNQAFDRSPAGTLAITNGLLSGVADIVAQGSQMTLAYRDAHQADSSPTPAPKTKTRSAETIPAYDPVRTVRFIIFGTMMGPFLARWNHFLERRFPLRPSNPNEVRAVMGAPIVQNVQSAMIKRAGAPTATSGRSGNVSLAALAKRVGMDQACMAPFGLVMFLGSMGVMEGRSTPEIREKFSNLFIPAIKANWTVWPLIQVVNFRFMPLAYRVPFQASCGVFWTLYISLLNSGGTKVAATAKKKEEEKVEVSAKEREEVRRVGERLGRPQTY